MRLCSKCQRKKDEDDLVLLKLLLVRAKSGGNEAADLIRMMLSRDGIFKSFNI